MNTGLIRAREAIVANRESGKTVKILNPEDKARDNPKSRKYAINSFCYECMGKEPGYSVEIRNCTAKDCPLYSWRPYQKKEENEDE